MVLLYVGVWIRALGSGLHGEQLALHLYAYPRPVVTPQPPAVTFVLLGQTLCGWRSWYYVLLFRAGCS